jgi:hypothetical protein
MFCHDFRVHRAGVFLILLMLLLLLACHAGTRRMRVIVFAARAIEVNRADLCSGANRECHRTDENKNPFFHITSDIFCSGSRVGCGGLHKCRRHACRYSGRLATPKIFGAR